jgi:hypothetical protein
MRILLAALMCLVLCTSECFALKGGPPIPGGQVTTTGNYAGLFVPAGEDENSLGIFSVSVPTTGLGSGVVAFFRNGIFYPGTIQAIADPDSAVLTATVMSSFDITFTSETTGNPPTTRNIVITFNANGSITGLIRPNPKTLSSATARITGNAAVTYATVGSAPGFDDSGANSNGPVPYEVNGFKQSEATR